MSGFELNKIAAAILFASLIAALSGFIANILYKPKLQPEERGFEIEVSDKEGESPASAKPEPLNIEEIMAKANAKEGAKVIKKCVSCHSFDKGGANKVGPNLWNVYMAKMGHRDDYSYSKAINVREEKWSEEKLFYFLRKPSKFMPGTKMSFAGLKKSEDIANIIAYLKEHKD